eukprot:SAG31_NODE_20548_length_571_cov_1.205508_1_plen_181_part_01
MWRVGEQCRDSAAWTDADGDGCAEYQASRGWCNRYGAMMQATKACPDTCRTTICLQRHFDNAARDHSACKAQPCHHGAECLAEPSALHGYECLCQPGWKGPTCKLVDYCAENVTDHTDGCVPPRELEHVGPDRVTRTTIVCCLTAAALACLSLVLGGHVPALRQCNACGASYSLGDGARLV